MDFDICSISAMKCSKTPETGFVGPTQAAGTAREAFTANICDMNISNIAIIILSFRRDGVLEYGVDGRIDTS